MGRRAQVAVFAVFSFWVLCRRPSSARYAGRAGCQTGSDALRFARSHLGRRAVFFCVAGVRARCAALRRAASQASAKHPASGEQTSSGLSSFGQQLACVRAPGALGPGTWHLGSWAPCRLAGSQERNARSWPSVSCEPARPRVMDMAGRTGAPRNGRARRARTVPVKFCSLPFSLARLWPLGWCCRVEAHGGPKLLRRRPGPLGALRSRPRCRASPATSQLPIAQAPRDDWMDERS